MKQCRVRLLFVAGLVMSAGVLAEPAKELAWSIRYGSYQGVERFAVKELHRMVSDFIPGCLVVDQTSSDPNCLSGHTFLVGTVKSNPMIARLANDNHIAIPHQAQGYVIHSAPSPWDGGKRVIVIAGADENGLLYGVEDFGARVLAPLLPDYATQEKRCQILETVGDRTLSDYPRITHRGIWTWGYTIYDYQRFLDHMARLKLNMITIWNSAVPANIDEFIAYAHDRGIRVVMGFHWGWGVGDVSIMDEQGRATIKQRVVDNFKANYANLDMDAIYFQTQTEHFETNQHGQSVACHAVELVNDVASALLAINPELDIHFGLHATSIQENYHDLKKLRPEVTVVWEDAGVIPYFYAPTPTFTEDHWKQSKINIGNPEGTLDYSRKLATFRKGTPFGMVAKGWANLNWATFKDHGPFLIGEYSDAYVREKRMARDVRWNRINTLWMKNYPIAARFYKELLPLCEKGMIVQALIEDGGFEASIEPASSLFGVMVWNPTLESDEMMNQAMSLYYTKMNH